jgi:hypothetical protein
MEESVSLPVYVAAEQHSCQGTVDLQYLLLSISAEKPRRGVGDRIEINDFIDG